MQEYYFLFGVVLVWMFFAVWQDMKTREIYNWLNFSLLGIALAYKAFLSFNRNDSSVFLISIAGALVFYGLANLFYYGKAFAGGDAKLLIAVGAALPYESYLDILILGGAFVFLLFLMGAMYSLVYSLFIVG
jgi:Flp pilus assembly protein protease CpaA